MLNYIEQAPITIRAWRILWSGPPLFYQALPVIVMPIQVQKVRIFIASPGDVQSEREQLSKVINELNQTISTHWLQKRELSWS